MDSRYIPADHEDRLYQKWQDSGAFAPAAASGKDHQTFTIMMPPPNANDPLHIGHAMFVALEDVMIRFHRMRGERVLWLPGTDHAGIETQFLFEKKLKKEGKSRFQFDRATLYQMIWEYVQTNSDVAVGQLKKLGASADWSRFRFMLEPSVVDEVLKTFSLLNEKGLIYRDLKLVNYCTHCGTGFSELEVKHVERATPFYYLKYGPFTIGTVRPETKFRDAALAVHPEDKRYKKYLGQTLSIPGLLGPIQMTVVADEGVDPEFGTGIMKVTPAHDAHDFELGQRYNLPVTPIITLEGKMDFSWFIEAGGHPDATPEENKPYLERARKYHGQKVAAARALMVEDLKTAGLLVKTDENYTHNASTCYRCGHTLEPLPLPQFFVKVAPLVQPVINALEDKSVRVHGAGHDKILMHWLTNLKDWNISRQIVWGIRLPVWYSTTTPELRVIFLDKQGEKVMGPLAEVLKNHSLEEVKAGLQEVKAPTQAEYVISPTSPGDEYLQETDTFDTWFSSGQWPFATLRSLDAERDTSDFQDFYPTSVMETGYDILPFWVMRMLMMGIFATGQAPFTDVYMHGLVRDPKGQKMSKSKGNTINPLSVIETHGADALRMALVIRSSAGLDKSVGEPDFKAMRNFTNKIWNATRFVLSRLDELSETGEADQATLARLSATTLTITQQLSDFKLGLAAETVFNEFWHWYCDEVIEAAKNGQISREVTLRGLTVFLTLLHPFVPFVTESVWQELHAAGVLEKQSQLLIAQPWPELAQ
jgi:valyl-tRNA synthetase